MDHNWFCLAKLPGGISCVGPDQLCNITPEGNMVAAPLDGVGKTLALGMGDVVADHVQRRDRDPRRLYGAADRTLTVDQGTELTDPWQRIAG